MSYQPAKNIEDLTIQDVLETMDAHGISDIPVEESEELRKIEGALRSFAERNKKSDANLLLKNL